MRIQMFEERMLKYVVRFPDEFSEAERYPVIFFLHGAGTRGEDLNLLCGNPYFSLTAQKKAFPFVTVAPLCSADTWYDLWEQVKKLVGEIAVLPYVDADRIYLMGASMGGYGTWQLAMSMPEVFAAAVPICGGGMYWNAARLAAVPVWAFHGAKDPVVLPEESVKMVDAVNRSGGNAKLTIYPENGHDAWSDTYSNEDVFAWLLQQQRKNRSIAKNEYDDAKRFG